MERELAYNILDIMGTMQDAVREMQKEYRAGGALKFEHLAGDLQDGLEAVKEIARQEIPRGSRNRLEDACICALESLKDIRRLTLVRPDKVEWKLEYELGSIVEDSASQFYYWGIVDKHPEERESFQKFVADAEAFRILKQREEDRKYACDLIILVTGYNKLEYTMDCVQNILDNLPKTISCELVLYNHGSSDSTKEYFESIDGANVINLAVNCAVPGALFRTYSRGKYRLHVSNDVIVGKNAIDNLYRCVSEHPDYGFVVPSTSAVSNYQTIEASYTSREEFLDFTRKNNVYDETRHEQRVRLVNPIEMLPSAVLLQMELDLYENKSCTGQAIAFPDDKVSLWMRRHGYKSILAKDAYCHHIGSVTINSQVTEEERDKMYLEGRKDFQAYYGVDPWAPGSFFEPKLFETMKIRPVNGACILGINCGLGSTSLKVKEVMREQGAEDVCLVNCIQDERYLQDLRGISDEVYVFSRLSDIVVGSKRKWYDYIVVEENIEGYRQERLAKEILNAGIEFGQLAYKLENEWRIYVHTTAK